MRTLSIPPHIQLRRRLWMAFILIGAVVLGTFQPATTSHADTGYIYYWSLTFDFESDIDGVLYVAVGYNDNGVPQDPPIYTQTSTVPCKRHGNATVSGGGLELNGGYLSCELDVYSALVTSIAACDARVSGCTVNIQDFEQYASFRGEATVQSALPGDTPIFYHQDASYAIHPQSRTTQITALLSPNPVTPSTPVLSDSILNTLHRYSALYDCEVICKMTYTAAEESEVIPAVGGEISFYTPLSTIFIGYNPDTLTTAPAGTTIEFLFVDPPRAGND